MKKIMVASTLFLLLCACKDRTTIPKITENKKQLYEKAGWLIGSWGNDSAKEKMKEIWTHDSDSVYIATSFVLVGADTIFSEKIRLAERNGKLYYIVSVPGQNNEKPVSFLLTSSTQDQLVFENPKHDFPSKITYRNFGNDSLIAEISGLRKEKYVRQEFRMKKIK